MNSHDGLIDRCERCATNPRYLLRCNNLATTLDRYHQILDAREERLFNSKREAIDFLELNDGDSGYQEETVRNSPDVVKHLRQNRQDPRLRFVFIQAATSRSALNCSRHSFSYISSFHQVPPTFIDFVSSFGRTSEPLDYHMTGFNGSDTLSEPAEDLLSIPELDRSGSEHCIQYLIRGVEASVRRNKPTSWNIRPMAVHHTYDFGSGRSLWINIKTNDVMKNRIQEGTKQFPVFRSSALETGSRSFAASLRAHIIHIEWCDENWRQCINDTEAVIREVLAKAKTARIDKQSKFSDPTFGRALTLQSKKTMAIGKSEKSSLGPLTFWHKLSNVVRERSWNPAAARITLASSDPSSILIQRPESLDEQEFTRQLKILDNFSLGEVQDLHHQGELLESYCLVMELNRQTLRDIAEHYDDLSRRSNFPKDIKKDCEKELAWFLRRIERTRKNLEIRITQVKSLLSWLEAGKSLFDGILQYQSVQVSQIFTKSSHIQSERMARIAYKTEKETISMHIITFVALSFLPGTFVAAFFQSGLLEINEEATGLSNAVKLHPSAFRLFLAICLPLMVLILFLWILLFKCLSRKARQQEQDVGV